MMKMKLLAALLVAVALVSCKRGDAPIFTTATVKIVAEKLDVIQLQATAKIININTKQVITTSAFVGNMVTEQLQRGAYLITVDGVVRCKEGNGEVKIKSFRAYTNYCELLGVQSEVSLPLILM